MKQLKQPRTGMKKFRIRKTGPVRLTSGTSVYDWWC